MALSVIVLFRQLLIAMPFLLKKTALLEKIVEFEFEHDKPQSLDHNSLPSTVMKESEYRFNPPLAYEAEFPLNNMWEEYHAV